MAVGKLQQTGGPVTHKRKKIGQAPHDLGVPEGDPFIAVNEPGWQDTNYGKDLELEVCAHGISRRCAHWKEGQRIPARVLAVDARCN